MASRNFANIDLKAKIKAASEKARHGFEATGKSATTAAGHAMKTVGGAAVAAAGGAVAASGSVATAGGATAASLSKFHDLALDPQLVTRLTITMALQ